MHFVSASPVLKCLGNMLWLGTSFDEHGNATTDVSRLIAGKTPEVGQVRMMEASSHDGRPCIRVDYADRWYEGRWIDDNNLLNIVTFRDASRFPDSGGVSDVHILTRVL